jgi:hypothetical protein
MAGRNESFAIFPPLAVVVVVVDDTDTSERLCLWPMPIIELH